MCVFLSFSLNAQNGLASIPRKVTALSGIHAKKKKPQTTNPHSLAARSTFSQLAKLGKQWVSAKLLKYINQVSWQHLSAKSQQKNQIRLQKDWIDTNGLLFSVPVAIQVF